MSVTLVTGGAGFLGLYIVERLVARGDRVRVFCRGTYPELRKSGVEVFQGDLKDRGAVMAACEGVETIFHTAAVPGISVFWKPYYETNTLGTRYVLDGCRKYGVRKLIYTSSPSVVFDLPAQENVDESAPYPKRWLTHYPRSKALAEQMVLAADGEKWEDGTVFSTCSLRPHLLWGPRDRHIIPRLLSRARAGKLFRVGDGTGLTDVIYVENAADAHLQAADALRPGSPLGGRAYFLSQGRPVNTWQWIDELLALAQLPPVKRSISYPLAYGIGTVLEWWYWLFRMEGEPVMTRFLASQLARSHYFDISAAKRDFGFEPKISIEEGMRRLAEDMRDRA